MGFIAKKNSGTFESNPMTAGFHPAVISDLAEREIPSYDDPSKMLKKVVARFVNAEGQEAARFYTPSLNEKSTLFKDLVGLGLLKANNVPDELDIEKLLLNRQCVVVISEGVSKTGSPTAKITAITKAPAGQNVVATRSKTAAAPPAQTTRRHNAPPPAVEDGTEISADEIPF